MAANKPVSKIQQINHAQLQEIKIKHTLVELDGEIDTTTKSINSTSLQLFIIFIIGIIIIALTVKTILTKDESPLDTIILVIIAGVFVFYILKYFNM